MSRYLAIFNVHFIRRESRYRAMSRATNNSLDVQDTGSAEEAELQLVVPLSWKMQPNVGEDVCVRSGRTAMNFRHAVQNERWAC